MYKKPDEKTFLISFKAEIHKISWVKQRCRFVLVVFIFLCFPPASLVLRFTYDVCLLSTLFVILMVIYVLVHCQRPLWKKRRITYFLSKSHWKFLFHKHFVIWRLTNSQLCHKDTQSEESILFFFSICSGKHSLRTTYQFAAVVFKSALGCSAYNLFWLQQNVITFNKLWQTVLSERNEKKKKLKHWLALLSLN